MTPTGEETTIVKVGGGADINLEGIAADLGSLVSPQSRFVVVLGANAYRSELATRLGASVTTLTSVSGVSSVHTDDEALELLTMAYAGVMNKRFVELCQRQGVNAIGLSGLDGGLVRGERNRGIRAVENGRKRLVRDRSGKPTQVNTSLLSTLLSEGYTPVLTVPILDENSHAINTDNDSVVTVLQHALNAERVVQLLEAKGLMRDLSDPESLISRLSADELREFRDASGGRIQRKLMAIADLAEGGCERIIVADGREPEPLRRAFSGVGTQILGRIHAV